jgi:hypothetical protein
MSIRGIELLINERKRVLACATEAGHVVWAHEVQDPEDQFCWQG